MKYEMKKAGSNFVIPPKSIVRVIKHVKFLLLIENKGDKNKSPLAFKSKIIIWLKNVPETLRLVFRLVNPFLQMMWNLSCSAK